MDNGPKIAIGISLVLILAVGGRVAWQYKLNHEEGPTLAQPAASRTLDEDDMVFLKKQRPDSLKDERALTGTTIWVSAANQMDYYVDKGKHVDYAKPVGLLKGAEPLLIKDVFEQKAPSTGRAVMRIAAGERQVLLGFVLPQSSDPAQMYAVPVGNYDQGLYTFFTDEIFFYDDPHQLYKHWGTAMWQHIDKHEPAMGMSENQAMMALGQVITPHGDKMGNRSVTYDNDGHPVTIEFENNKAVKITPG